MPHKKISSHTLVTYTRPAVAYAAGPVLIHYQIRQKNRSILSLPYALSLQIPELSGTGIMVESIEQELATSFTKAFLRLRLQSGLLIVMIPVTVDYVYQGTWEAVSSNLQEISEEEFFSNSEFVYAVPSGTYQTILGHSGFVSSIHIVEEPLDTENPLHCQVISIFMYDDCQEIQTESSFLTCVIHFSTVPGVLSW